MKALPVTIIAAVLLVSIAGGAEEVARPTTKKLKLPPAWQAVEPNVRMETIRVAELDATRLLMERISGVALNSDTIIYDLLLRSDDIASGVRAVMRGVTTTEGPVYNDDGSLEVVRKVRLHEVVQVITQKFKTQATATGLVTTSDLVKVEEQCRDAEIAVMGNGALPNSHGLRKIRAKRAAELDAYRKLLERLMGVEVTSETKVKKFILESDVIAARAAAWVKGAKPVKIEYADDDSCEVTMQIKVADIFRVIKKYDKSTDTYRRELTKLETEYATTTFTETGSGAPQPRSSDARILEAAVPRTEQQAMVEPFKETSIVVKQLVGQRVVLE